MTVYSSTVLLLLIAFSWSCQPPDRHLLVQAYWQLEAIKTDPQLIEGPGAMDLMADCEKDDVWKFATNGILKTVRGNERCDPDENFIQCVGGWTLSATAKYLTIQESGGFETTYEILLLKQEMLQMRFTADEATITLSYKSIPPNLLARED